MSLALDAGPEEPLLPGWTIGRALDAAVSAWPSNDALVSVEQGVRLTYSELSAEVDGVARGLIARGVSRGDRVGIWAPNCAEWVIVQYATARLGAILVTVNPAYRTNELAYVMKQAGVSLLIAASKFKTSDYVAMAIEAAPNLPSVFFGTAEWDALRTGAGGEQIPDVELSPTDPINIQYTSGTTGFPKGATLSHRNILGNGFLVGEACNYTPDDRICVPVPFYHCFGMVMGNLAALTHGASVVIPAPAFDPAATLSAVASERCTSLYGVPTMFIAELALEDLDSYDLSSLRTGIMAGSPCPVEVMKNVSEFMPEVTIAYGMTETSPVSTQTKADDTLEHRTATVGRVHPHVTIKIVDRSSGEIVERGETGELCTAGYGLMLGYWDDPEMTSEAVDSEGFIHTGDLAMMDMDGYISIVGRSKDMVIRGGENVYPREIEEFLYTHPDILDAQVIGVPDAKYGEELCAWVRLRDGATFGEEDLRQFCHGKLSHYKIPRYLRITQEFPMTVTGKVQKFKMREVSIEELSLQGAACIVTA
ncbi:AMP-binding protein [Jatrophihabitans cynanchi]|uniref:AMP-binding protein n=1 Tax=Jatrophihabitans cynanchi TaxID=2944128 RepID=A0ABY7K198_9ACTN|nr:AMP-binding protein [Jatrophihabitans sp. SB3-54]WAX58444.1 AMP-binding protein [Jatrophihabitans sp. SB3-54]